VLTLTPEATTAIEGILDSPDVPDGAGIRIAAGETPTGGAVGSQLQVAIAQQPEGSDEVIEQEGALVFLEDNVTEFLADKQLDAEVVDERVGFTIAAQSA
jgi:iron-sulfur cluster assembly protein